MLSRSLGAIAFIALFNFLLPAHAQAAAKSAPKLRVSATVRSYQFNHSFRSGSYQQAQNNALALHLQYGGKRGLSAVATYFAADPLHHAPANGDTSLPADRINALGELYAQYTQAGFVARAGRQVVETPWVNAADARLIPVSFSGITARAQIGPEFSVYGARLGSWRNRTRSNFASDDLLTAKATAGTLIGGVTYARGTASASIWQYEFYDVARLTYADAAKSFSLPAAVLRVKAQYAAEGNLGASFAGPIRSHVAGALLDAAAGRLDVSAAFDIAPFAAGAYRHGGPASPYAYTTDPLYTTSMVTGLYNTGAGWSYKAAAAWLTADKRGRASLSRAMYFTGVPRGATATAGETDLDLSYAVTRRFSVRNRTAFITSLNAPYQQTYNRVQFEYTVSGEK